MRFSWARHEPLAGQAPVEGKQRALDAPRLTQGCREAVLAQVAATLAEHPRGRHRALFDGRGKLQNVVPMSADMLDVDFVPIKLCLTAIAWEILTQLPDFLESRRHIVDILVGKHGMHDVITKDRVTMQFFHHRAQPWSV